VKYLQISTYHKTYLEPSDVIFLLKHHLHKCNREGQFGRSDTNKRKKWKTVFIGLISGIQQKHIMKRVNNFMKSRCSQKIFLTSFE